MRLSILLGKTLRQPPSEAHLPSHQLLVRASYLRGLEAGLFAYLPLGQRALDQLQVLLRRELAPLDAQEVAVPRTADVDPTRTLVQIIGREVDSYRQLPLLLYGFTTQAMGQPRVRAGLFGATVRPVAEIHAFGDADLAVADKIVSAMEQVFAACTLGPVWADVGKAGQRAYILHRSGDDDLVRCSACSYAAERSWAQTAWPEPPGEEELAPEEIATPDCDTIASLAEFLDIPPAKTLKMVFSSVEGSVTCVVIRGDRAVDEDKLARVLGTDQYYASLEDELAAIGAVGGYASPIGLDQTKVRVVADPSVRSGKNFVSGANRPDYHIQNVNIPRDFRPGEWADLAKIESGDTCPNCGGTLEIEPAFALAYGTLPAACEPQVEYLDSEGRPHPLWVSTWRLDLGRLLAATVEAHHDEYGIVWPLVCAPFDVHLVALDLRKEEVAAQAETLYERLKADGLSVLYDDRDASAGVKFNDADLIGIPLRLTVSKRSVEEGAVEAKWRNRRERLQLDEDGLAIELARLRAAR